MFMPDINHLLNLLTKFAWLGDWLFLILAFIESAPFIGLVIPGATFITIGGFLASQGYLNVFDIIIFATIGAILGDFFSYFLGRWSGDWIKRKRIINQTILRHGENFFKRHGDKSVFLGRFFGPIRAVIPFIAGLSKMKVRPFIFWNILSSIGWAILNVLLGYFSGTLIVAIFNKWANNFRAIHLGLILTILLGIYIFYLIIKHQGQSIVTYFKTTSLIFVTRLNNYSWFKKLTSKYSIINDFLIETKYAPEKLFGSVCIFVFLTFLYLLAEVIEVI
jgi:membrane protein DedA with SNARE-associated domain